MILISFINFFTNCLFKSFAYFLMGFVVVDIFNINWNINPLSIKQFASIFSYSAECFLLPCYLCCTLQLVIALYSKLLRKSDSNAPDAFWEL